MGEPELSWKGFDFSSLTMSTPGGRLKAAAYMREWIDKNGNRARVNANIAARHAANPEHNRGRDRLRSQKKAAKTRVAFHGLVDRLKAVPCQDCAGLFHFAAMDFDHVRGEKKFNVAMGASFSKSALLEEIAKCDVVCSNCHRIRTYKRRING